MLSSLTLFVLTFGMLFFLPWEPYLYTTLLIYSLLNLYRLYHRDIRILDFGIWMIWGVITVVQCFGGDMNVMTYTGTFFYAGLSFVCLFGAILNKPFTLSRARRNDHEALALHKAASIIMSVGYLSALYFSLSLRMDPSYVYAPAIIALLSIFAGIYLAKPILIFCRAIFQILYTPKEDREKVLQSFDNKRGICIVKNHLVGKEVITKNDKALFFQVLDQTYFRAYQRSARKNDDYTAFQTALRTEYDQYARFSHSFVVCDLQTKRPVGTVRLVAISNRNKNKIKLPLEECTTVDLKPLKEKGYIVGEFGRMSILASGPSRLSILELLLQMTMIKSVLNGLDLITNLATKDSVKLHQRLGFKCVNPPIFDDELNQPVYLFWSSLPNMLGMRFKGTGRRIKNISGADFFIALYLFMKKVKLRKMDEANIEKMISFGEVR